MSDVFISYSRNDRDFVRLLFNTLETNGRDAWVDWEDIPASAEWWLEIQRAIESADTFVFVISPDSVTAKWCRQEIDHAVKHNKRMIPIYHREVAYDSMHTALQAINWISFREEDDFDISYAKLVETIDTDLEWVRVHTRLLVRAIEWSNSGRDSSFLLRGIDLAEAEQWLAQGVEKEPAVTDLHAQYILTSLEDATGRQRRTISLLIGGLALVLILAGLSAFFGVRSQRNAHAEATAQMEATQRVNAEAAAQTEATQRANAEATAQIEAEQRATAQSVAIQAEEQSQNAWQQVEVGFAQTGSIPIDGSSLLVSDHLWGIDCAQGGLTT
jgi:hypothetical protein